MLGVVQRALAPNTSSLSKTSERFGRWPNLKFGAIHGRIARRPSGRGMSNKKPEPLVPDKQPNICPVCGKASYSAAGIHPQCSVKKADQERVEKRKEQAKAENESSNPTEKTKVSRWLKTCPKCKTLLHIRKTACECGHAFQ